MDTVKRMCIKKLPKVLAIQLKRFDYDWERYVTAGNYMFKVNSKNARTRCELCSKLTIKTLEQRQTFTYSNSTLQVLEKGVTYC